MVLLEIIKQINWIDIFVVIILFRVGYISIKNGLPIVFFKLLGTIAAVYLSLHYYTNLTDFIRSFFKLDKGASGILDFICLVVLATAAYLFFVLLRMFFYRFVKLAAVLNLDKWGGFVLGIVRAILMQSLIVYMLVVSGIGYLNNSVKNSFSGSSLIKIAPETYIWLWNSIASKFMAKEKFNNNVIDVVENITKK